MRREERGSASMLVISAAGVLMGGAVALGVVAGMVAAHRQAQAAADLAALAGAGAVARGGDGCAAAEELASANTAELRSCRVAGREVWVKVAVSGPDWPGAGRDLVAHARAGP